MSKASKGETTKPIIKAKKSGVLYAEFYADGERRRVSLETRDMGAAKLKLPKIIAGNDQPPVAKHAPSPGRVTMAQLFDRCQATIWSPREVRSQATVRSNIRKLNTLIGRELVCEITAGRLRDLAEQLFTEGYAAGTVSRKMDAVSAALGHATEETYPDGTPWLIGKPKMPSITVDNFLDRVVSRAEEDAIFAAIAKRNFKEPTRDWQRFHCLIRFLLDTGCRLSEALRLKTTDVEPRDISGREVHFALFPRYLSKNKKPRQIPLTNEVVAFLPHLAWRAHESRYFPFSAATAWFMWSNIRKDMDAAGRNIDDVKLHTMRHTCLTRLARSGKVRIERISEWAGHSNIQITITRYAHLLPEDQVATLDVLNAMAQAA